MQSVFIVSLFTLAIMVAGCESQSGISKVKNDAFNASTSQSSSKVNNTIEAGTDSIRFHYSEITGIGIDSIYNRRDNSDVIRIENKYYVWYTRMDNPITSGYWGTIWYAISEDEGHTWQEQGMALGLGEKGTFDSHSVFTPNILVYHGKYYMYYTGVRPTPSNRDNNFENNSVNDFTAIGLAIADSPDGPFTRVNNNPVLNISKDSVAFDSYRIDDASLIIRDQKIWLYYKGRSIIHGKKGPRLTKMGVAFADHPTGPFTKHKQEIMDHSHEVLIWQEDKGIASLASINKTINYAADGLDFQPLYINLNHIPKAPGLYRPFLTEGGTASEIPGWGISMINKNKKVHLLRFEIKKN